MKVFITGGTGFIGKHLIETLRNSNHEIMLLLLDNEALPDKFPDDFKSIKGNLSNIDEWIKDLDCFNPDAVIHMAWQGLPDYSSELSEKNLKYGTDFISKIANIGCKKIITTGSCWEYGRTQGKLDESMNAVSNNAFTSAKNSLYKIGNEISKENDITFIWTRLFYVYGPFQRPYSLIPHLINNVKNGRKPDIKTPDTKNDFIYVGDVAEALNLILEKCKNNNIFNIGSGRSTSVRNIVDLVCKKYNFYFKLPDEEKPEKAPIDFWADISKIKKEIGWKPKTNIEEGIEKTIEYYNNEKLLINEV